MSVIFIAIEDEENQNTESKTNGVFIVTVLSIAASLVLIALIVYIKMKLSEEEEVVYVQYKMEVEGKKFVFIQTKLKRKDIPNMIKILGVEIIEIGEETIRVRVIRGSNDGKVTKTTEEDVKIKDVEKLKKTKGVIAVKSLHENEYETVEVEHKIKTKDGTERSLILLETIKKVCRPMLEKMGMIQKKQK